MSDPKRCRTNQSGRRAAFLVAIVSIVVATTILLPTAMPSEGWNDEKSPPFALLSQVQSLLPPFGINLTVGAIYSYLKSIGAPTSSYQSQSSVNGIVASLWNTLSNLQPFIQVVQQYGFGNFSFNINYNFTVGPVNATFEESWNQSYVVHSEYWMGQILGCGGQRFTLIACGLIGPAASTGTTHPMNIHCLSSLGCGSGTISKTLSTNWAGYSVEAKNATSPSEQLDGANVTTITSEMENPTRTTSNSTVVGCVHPCNIDPVGATWVGIATNASGVGPSSGYYGGLLQIGWVDNTYQPLIGQNQFWYEFLTRNSEVLHFFHDSASGHVATTYPGWRTSLNVYQVINSQTRSAGENWWCVQFFTEASILPPPGNPRFGAISCDWDPYSLGTTHSAWTPLWSLFMTEAPSYNYTIQQFPRVNNSAPGLLTSQIGFWNAFIDLNMTNQTASAVAAGGSSVLDELNQFGTGQSGNNTFVSWVIPPRAAGISQTVSPEVIWLNSQYSCYVTTGAQC